MKKEKLAEYVAQHTTMLETHLQFAITSLQNLSQEQLNKQSKDGGWSAVECIEHLNTYAQFYHPQLFASQLSAAKAGELYKEGWLATFLINSIDPNRPTKKMKAMKLHEPKKNQDPAKVIALFIEHLESLLIWLNKNRNNNLNKGKIKTSLSSFITQTPAAIVRFLILHNERHLRQAKRALQQTD